MILKHLETNEEKPILSATKSFDLRSGTVSVNTSSHWRLGLCTEDVHAPRFKLQVILVDREAQTSSTLHLAQRAPRC